jgi:copper oxidase (laccase) domain-containing protein
MFMIIDKRQAAVDEVGGEELVFADGFDEAIIGVAQVHGAEVVVYDEELVIQALMADGLDDTEAREYFDFNVARAYVGEQTPIFVRRLSRE